jgi:ribonucleoside-diphosphate reductase alpha chain
MVMDSVGGNGCSRSIINAEAWERTTRQRLAAERKSVTCAIDLHDDMGTIEMYLTIGLYPDGSVGEVFVKGVGREGSPLQGLLDAWCVMVSIALQQGTSLKTIARKFSGTKFDPKGKTDDVDVGVCTSLLDLIVHKMVAIADIQRNDDVMQLLEDELWHA